MSGSAHDGGPVTREKDPLLRFLLGCAIVLGGLLAIVIGGCGFFAWRLMRDETPGRPVEAFVLGDENRYWCAELDPGDPGLVALMERVERINAGTRQRALEHTPLAGLPIPSRRADLHEVLPLRLELGLADSGGWSGRATVSKGGLRLRAGAKLMRWLLTRDAAKAEAFDVDGVGVTLVHDAGKTAAFASVGNRILFADGVERMRRHLALPEGPVTPRLAGIAELHQSMRLDGEDAWGFAADTEVEGPTRALPLRGAVASFDLAPEDELRVRVVVPAGDGAGLATLSPEEARAILRSFLPHVPDTMIDLDSGTPALEGARLWRIEGRVSALTSRLANLLGESPSAIRIEPSPRPTSDPRSGTPSEPPRAGTPTPAD